MNPAQRIALAVSLALVAAVAGACVLGVRACFRTSEDLWPARVEGVRTVPARPPLDADGVGPDNACFFLRQITNLAWRAEDRDAWRAELKRLEASGASGAPYPLLDTFLASNAAAFELWDIAGAVTGAQCVTVRNLLDTGPSLAEVLLLARTTPYRAERAVWRGEWSEAVRIWQGGLRSCDHLSRGSTFVHALIHGAGVRTIARHVRRTLLASNAPPETVRLMRDFLLRLDAGAEPPAETWRYECLALLGTVDLIYRRPELLLEAGGDSDARKNGRKIRAALGVARLAGSTPERTRAHIEALYSRLIRVVEAPFDPGAFERELGDFNRRHRSSLYLLNDPIGRLMASLSMPALDNVQWKLLAAPADRRGTSAALAVVLHQRDHHGEPPETLAHLVPSYLPAVPADPYSKDGAPLRYRRGPSASWRLYSIGPNQKDDDGREPPPQGGNEAETKPDDLVFDASLLDPTETASRTGPKASADPAISPPR